MKVISFLALMCLIFQISFCQNVFQITYDALKTFEGRYEYKGSQTLEMAASPVDGKLYAIITNSRYALNPVRKDVFMNNGKQEVSFIRDENAMIIGYKIHDDSPDRLYKMINHQVSFSPKIWYPRSPADSVYVYEVPRNMHDGLTVGSMNESGLDTAVLKDMEENLPAAGFPMFTACL